MVSIDPTAVGTAPANADTGVNKFYFAAWRWHFYAGLYVIPFLLMLAVSGFFIMLFTTYLPEYGDRIAVAPGAAVLSIADQNAAALAAVSGATAVTEYVLPYDAATPALVKVATDAAPMVVALDPYTGATLRFTEQDNTWNTFLTKIQGTLLIGDLGDRLIEIAASLGLVLVATGLYLWWPRGGQPLSRALIPELSARGRALWKSLHLTSSIWMSVILVFFLITGLAWAGVWGEKFVQAWNTFPAEKWGAPLSDATHVEMNHEGEKQVPWTLEGTQMPESGSIVGMAILTPGTPITFDTVAAMGQLISIPGRFHVIAPADETGVWTLSQDSMSYDSTNPTADRTVHIDQYTGHVLADVRYADYGLGGKAMAVGIALHEAQLGLWNFVLNTVFCLLIVLICVASLVMWWKRRPAGALRLAAPPMPKDMPLWKGAVLVGLFLCLAFPMAGVARLIVLAVDVLILSWMGPLKRVLS